MTHHATTPHSWPRSAADSALALEPAASRTPPATPFALGDAALRRLLWRVHFWAGLITAPLVLAAALTGLLYVFSPQIETWRHATLDQVPPAASARPLDEQVAAAQRLLPGWQVRSVTVSPRPGETTRVLMQPQAAEAAGLASGHAHHGGAAVGTAPAGSATPSAGALHRDHLSGLPAGRVVHVDPGTAQPVGMLDEMQRFSTWARHLHSSWLQGDAWRWPIELAASWLLVMMASGLALWWPRSRASGGPGWRALRPRRGRGRATWRDLHAVVALSLGAVLAAVLVTGLTWSRHAGENFRHLQQVLAQESPRPPAGLQSGPAQGRPPLGWQAVWERAAQQAPGVRLVLTPPSGPLAPWRADSAEPGRPLARASLRVDPYSGDLLFRAGWSDLPLLSKATAVGIPFHRGEFGLWNQLLLAACALAVVFSVVSGVAMWWLRRPPGRLSVPPLPRRPWRAAPAWLWAAVAALGWALPVFGLSALALMVAETLTASLRRPGGQPGMPLRS